MTQLLHGAFEIGLSYDQFTVADKGANRVCGWSDAHIRQGFARRESTVSFLTLIEYGMGVVRVYSGPYLRSELYKRVIEVPIHLRSGRVDIRGPEDSPRDVPSIELNASWYRLTCAQWVVTEENGWGIEEIDLHFEYLKPPITRSEILLADGNLDPPQQLLETADLP